MKYEDKINISAKLEKKAQTEILKGFPKINIS